MYIDCVSVNKLIQTSHSLPQVTVSELFSDLPLERSTMTSLTMAKSLSEVKRGQTLQVPPMEISALRMDFKQ